MNKWNNFPLEFHNIQPLSSSFLYCYWESQATLIPESLYVANLFPPWKCIGSSFIPGVLKFHVAVPQGWSLYFYPFCWVLSFWKISRVILLIISSPMGFFFLFLKLEFRGWNSWTNSQFFLSFLIIPILHFYGCYDKLPQAGWL